MPTELVPVPSVLLDRLLTLGVDAAQVLRHAGIVPSRFQPPRARLTVAEFFAFWRALEQVGARRDLGVRLGGEAPPHQFDVASLAALHAPTLGEAFQKFARYKRVVCGEQVTIDRGDGEARVGFHWLHIEEALPLLLVDATFSSLVALGRRGTGQPLTPLRIELARSRSDEAMFRQHFGCEIRFDAPLDFLVFEESALARPFITHNADLLALMVPGLEAALTESLSSASVADDVRSILGRRMCGERPSVDKVAREMRMSSRTLQRRLEQLGTSYQGLLDQVRRDTSRRLLENTHLELGEVAFLLGFEELNSFSRAFHTWEGVTPNSWRQRVRSTSS
ncbi:AraC family transcriptional regulator [Hyalangium rubrum]|uniref:AraC family transcriptional regulator n=1 Tax=Hyalangium rubrum TaxID=3103134 RepID=A0ABU5H2I0_9BACT|nr:AraC family transcriptional regulator [Hyalangium sp. s54d21]MDY7226992.1 AraC family transcriptional regulator [Hyalangium sp. s54d21]